MLAILAVLGLGLAGLVVYLWWQRRPLAPGALARRAPLPAMMALRKSTVIAVGALTLLACVGTVYLVRAYWPSRRAKASAPAQVPPAGPSPAAAFLDKFPKEYAMVQPVATPEPKPELPPRGVPVPPSGGLGVAHAAIPPQALDPAEQRREAQMAALLASVQTLTQAMQQEQAQRRALEARLAAQGTQNGGQGAQAPAPEVPSRKRKWEDLAAPDKGKASEPAAGQGQQKPTADEGTLIKPARWEIPGSPLRTVYRSQTLTGKLLQGISSDIPGQVKIQLTTPVLDRFGYDTTIIPKDAIIIASQDGRPSYGASRLAIRLEQLEFPDGAVVNFKAAIGDQEGANGLKGKRDSHIGSLVLATGLSAILNIGVRTAAGTPGRGVQFQNPAQGAAQDIGNSIQNDAQSIVDRELRIPPTITVRAGEFCTINLSENVQFNHAPTLVR